MFFSIAAGCIAAQVPVLHASDAGEYVLEGAGSVLQFSLSEDEKFLYALSSRGTASIPEGDGNLLHTLSISNDGTVAETVGPYYFHLPTGVRPQGVTVANQY